MLQPIRVVHTADLHLGSPFRAFPERAACLREEQLACLARLVSFCAEHRVHILLLAGDLFDAPLPAGQTVRTAAELFASIPDTAVFIAAGNHDPAFIDSPYRTLPWPVNVHCFTDELTAVESAQLPVRVHGAGFTATAAVRSLLPILPQPAATDRLNLLVLHGDLVTRGQSSVYNPLSLEQLEHFGMDYTALGHRHDATAMMRSGRGSVAYSGCPLGRGFDETGQKSFRLLDFAETGAGRMDNRWSCVSELVIPGGRIFHETAVPVGECTTHDEIADRILAQLKSAGMGNWPDNFCRILLRGETDDSFAVLPALLQQRLDRELFFIEVIDETEHRLDLAALATEGSLRGTFVRLLTEKLALASRQGQTAEAERLRRALSMGLEAFSGEVKLHANS